MMAFPPRHQVDPLTIDAHIETTCFESIELVISESFKHWSQLGRNERTAFDGEAKVAGDGSISWLAEATYSLLVKGFAAAFTLETSPLLARVPTKHETKLDSVDEPVTRLAISIPPVSRRVHRNSHRFEVPGRGFGSMHGLTNATGVRAEA